MTEETLNQRAERIVRQGVYCGLSHIVATLARHSYTEHGDLLELMEQAAELSSPVPDYEEAARQAGWSIEETTREGSSNWYAFKIEDGAKKIGSDQFENPQDAWRDLCEQNDIEPYNRDMFEHWAVSQWLADKLILKGEKVDTDFGGLCVWARTTTGQAICMDSVILDIARETT